LNIIRISIINTFDPPPPPPRDFVGLFGENCPQHCKQDLPLKVGAAIHAVISKKIG
jgi:hypothetical protein